MTRNTAARRSGRSRASGDQTAASTANHAAIARLVSTSAHFLRGRRARAPESSSGGTLWPTRLSTGSRPRREPESTTASRTAGMMIVSVLKIQPTRTTTW